MNYISIGPASAITVVFGHGWGRSHRDFIPVAESIVPYAQSILLDLPGFGDSPRPSQAWGSAQYADHVSEFLANELQTTAVIWVGHSFGGRIGLRLAVRHPQQLSAMVLVASAGIPVARSATSNLRQRLQRQRFKFARSLAKDQAGIEKLEKQFGSADYVHSAELGMRDVFLKLVAEDQSSDVASIKTPTTLVYGAQDTETPVSIGQRIHELIPQSSLIVCPEFGHIDVLNRGRHQIALIIKEYITAVQS